MNQVDVVISQMGIIRAQCLALVAQLDALEASLHAPSTLAAEVPSQCPHPLKDRVSRAAMGHANRFYCRACKQEVEE